ncbi:hypothetical protein B0O80DRAFT_456107 [Mortierella sp. GBAus27b]|nr:hypothetical protein B0O80DRAFT_456107 [Mortierella sp. GBAus27b]
MFLHLLHLFNPHSSFLIPLVLLPTTPCIPLPCFPAFLASLALPCILFLHVARTTSSPLSLLGPGGCICRALFCLCL